MAWLGSTRETQQFYHGGSPDSNVKLQELSSSRCGRCDTLVTPLVRCAMLQSK